MGERTQGDGSVKVQIIVDGVEKASFVLDGEPKQEFAPIGSAPAEAAPNGPGCPHGPMKWKSGTSKNGKPYKGWFCVDDVCSPQWA
jgi:hypothetical protein